jgi:hypothetical protein
MRLPWSDMDAADGEGDRAFGGRIILRGRTLD